MRKRNAIGNDDRRRGNSPEDPRTESRFSSFQNSIPYDFLLSSRMEQLYRRVIIRRYFLILYNVNQLSPPSVEFIQFPVDRFHSYGPEKRWRRKRTSKKTPDAGTMTRRRSTKSKTRVMSVSSTTSRSRVPLAGSEERTRSTVETGVGVVEATDGVEWAPRRNRPRIRLDDEDKEKFSFHTNRFS